MKGRNALAEGKKERGEASSIVSLRGLGERKHCGIRS